MANDKDLADKVRAAVASLNEAIAEAARGGLTVVVRQHTVQTIGSPEDAVFLEAFITRKTTV